MINVYCVYKPYIWKLSVLVQYAYLWEPYKIMGERNAGSECWAWIKRWQNTLNSKNHLSMAGKLRRWVQLGTWVDKDHLLLTLITGTTGQLVALRRMNKYFEKTSLGWSNSMVCSLSGFCEEQVCYSLSAWTPKALLCWDLSSYPWGSLAFHNSKAEASFCALVIRGARKKAKASAFSSGFP